MKGGKEELMGEKIRKEQGRERERKCGRRMREKNARNRKGGNCNLWKE